ncbi:putative membrane protein YdjX (TVP38/TMEM64 family) [Streptomonospora nanhaiensis]|uniref:Putative membrane protein YdjX (TVP38/TMEM64 family) n=1 Tax=Streptomonospora nanhaiensis TaxID=1323731 RepID=A0A853BXX1_9ACTN|nr:hypothetical protein [Streptomonospora nanhaiensis]NYI99297.1 putative membrane protein YdjX (TVP38/TMEM64 family) [Streptomonospora nanhaiensis]
MSAETAVLLVLAVAAGIGATLVYLHIRTAYRKARARVQRASRTRLRLVLDQGGRRPQKGARR